MPEESADTAAVAGNKGQSKRLVPHVQSDAIIGTGTITRLLEVFDHEVSMKDHQHRTDAIVIPESGSLDLTTEFGFWIVPRTMALWIPATRIHAMRSHGPLTMTVLRLDPGMVSLGTRCRVVHVSDLLRATAERVPEYPQVYPPDGPTARIVSVILDELRAADMAPMALPFP